MTSSDKYLFAEFCFDAQTGELFNNNTPVTIPPKQAELLLLFLQSPQQLITRETIQNSIWSDTVVEFDQSLNYAIKELRKVLGDDAKAARFIETVPRKGYRFKELPIYLADSKSAQPSSSKLTLKHWIAGGLVGIVAAVSFSAWYAGSVSSNSQTQIQKQVNSTALARANYLFAKSDAQSLQRSIPLFEQHLQQYPSDGNTHALAAIAYIKSAPDSRQKEKVAMHLENAQLYAPQSAQTQLALALFALYFEWHVANAYDLALQAMQASPDWILGWHELAVIQVILNEHEAALQSIERLMALAPGVALERFHAGWFYQLNKQPKLALQHYQHSLEINDQQPLTYLFAALTARDLNAAQHERQFLLGFVNSLPIPEQDKQVLTTHITLGEHEKLWQWWQQWLVENNADYFMQALAFALTEDKTNTLKALQIAVENKATMFPAILAFRQFDFLDNDPVFQKLTGHIQRQ